MFNSSEFHLSEMTCYKIHTLRVCFPKYYTYCVFRDGTKDNYKAIRARCKAEGVSVGSIALAASYLAMAEIHAKSSCSDMSQYQVSTYLGTIQVLHHQGGGWVGSENDSTVNHQRVGWVGLKKSKV